MSTIKGKAAVRIGRRTSALGPDSVTIMVQDGASNSLVEATLSLEQFAQAIMGLHIGDAEAEWCYPERLGLVREHKTVNVPWEGKSETTPSQLKEALAPYEVDGWKGRLDDLGNHHNQRECGTYAVTFLRWVKP